MAALIPGGIVHLQHEAHLPCNGAGNGARDDTKVMKMAYVTGARGGSVGLTDRIAGMARELADRWRRYRVFRETMRELEALSDRDLADLGIHRSQIASIAREAAYGG